MIRYHAMGTGDATQGNDHRFQTIALDYGNCLGLRYNVLPHGISLFELEVARPQRTHIFCQEEDSLPSPRINPRHSAHKQSSE
jgi:hypothetical protein